MNNLTTSERGIAYAVRALCHELASNQQLSDESIELAKSYLGQLSVNGWSGELVKRVTDIMADFTHLDPALSALYAALCARPTTAYRVEAIRKVEQIGVATIHAFSVREARDRAKATPTHYEWTTKDVIGVPQFTEPSVPKEIP